jgi:hypothetical protein
MPTLPIILLPNAYYGLLGTLDAITNGMSLQLPI